LKIQRGRLSKREKSIEKVTGERGKVARRSLARSERRENEGTIKKNFGGPENGKTGRMGLRREESCGGFPRRGSQQGVLRSGWEREVRKKKTLHHRLIKIR